MERTSAVKEKEKGQLEDDWSWWKEKLLGTIEGDGEGQKASIFPVSQFFSRTELEHNGLTLDRVSCKTDGIKHSDQIGSVKMSDQTGSSRNQTTPYQTHISHGSLYHYLKK